MRLLLSGYYGFGNLGDDALLEVTSAQLHARYPTAVPQASQSPSAYAPPERCRDCHGGSKPVEKKVTSNCLMCHGFHEASHPWDPDFKPRDTTRVAQEAHVAH